MSLPEPVALALREAGLDPLYVEDLIRATLEEDLGGGADVTTVATVPEEQWASAVLEARQPGVIAGVPVVEAVFAAVGGADVELERHVADGDAVDAGAKVLTVGARSRDVLLAERTALNLAGRLSGIATATRAWVEAAGDGAVVRDTRKTTPLMRTLEKYAVRVGGAANHRSTLSESALIKDNHVVAAGGVGAAYRAVREAYPDVDVEVEVDDVAGAVEAVEAGAELVLLDNFTVDEVTDAVQAVDGRARLEVSGGLTLDAAGAYAATGVDYLSTGALTHSVQALDLGLEIVGVDAGAAGS
ncbi:nicotinate-nucleotide pyrophosphorylase [carboxylating] [Haloactinopolyspora alba]|uniref:Nicotinate-nucleotide pyrophosphorylase [carboxylating] n=1 Tax=Haloactinopolyspora alba TaxID=648780 RepID=A0A2P8DZ14_9ACTN|nr:carboxylating nicotinate-nucleotide diphosphorylase [Haloactinopolyspora alba]PSL02450.1 nicotinate-nucleotide pyrophosphorylase [carboxylating] [Haloactinopolyspora alba]